MAVIAGAVSSASPIASRQRVDAAQAAEQRHDGAAVLGDGEHRRLGPLVLQHRRQRADHDAGGAKRDDRHVVGEQLAQGRRRNPSKRQSAPVTRPPSP